MGVETRAGPEGGKMGVAGGTTNARGGAAGAGVGSRWRKAFCSSRQLPVAAVTDRLEELVGFGVVDDDLLGGIPFEGAFVPDSQIAQVAHGNGATADLHVANGPLPAPDAFEEVLEMVIA